MSDTDTDTDTAPGGVSGRPLPPMRWGPRQLPIPYAARWSGEAADLGMLAPRPDGRGICYRDERRTDRDDNGVLWCRLDDAPGRGRPNFGQMHPRRQREAQLGRLCQVCGGPASRTSRGWLFLMPLPDPSVWRNQPGWPEGAHSTKPPLCVRCAVDSVRLCPHLGRPFAVRVRKVARYGVFGGFLLPEAGGGLRPLPGEEYLPYGHADAPFFLAQQLVVELRRCTPVDLGGEG